MIDLFLLGLVVGLSGVLIPGPLLVYTISESLKKGMIGHIIISAHVLIEAGIVALLLMGVSMVVRSLVLQKAIGIIGGVAMMIFGIYYILHPTRVEEEKVVKVKSSAPFVGGLIFTALNPSFLPWWIAIGAPIIFKSFLIGGMIGVVVVMLGHWTGDFGWYLFVSYFSNRAKRFLSERTHKILMIVMGIALLCMGAYFLSPIFS